MGQFWRTAVREWRSTAHICTSVRAWNNKGLLWTRKHNFGFPKKLGFLRFSRQPVLNRFHCMCTAEAVRLVLSKLLGLWAWMCLTVRSGGGGVGVRQHTTVLYHYELIYQLNAIEYLLCTFSSTCFGLTRPSSGAMDVIISFTYTAYGVLGVVWCRSWGVCVLVVCCSATAVQHATSTHTPQDRHLTTPRTPYAAYVKKL